MNIIFGNNGMVVILVNGGGGSSSKKSLEIINFYFNINTHIFVHLFLYIVICFYYKLTGYYSPHSETHYLKFPVLCFFKGV